MKKIVFFMMCLLAMACGGNSNNATSQPQENDVELQSNEFYKGLLESFCKKYYEEKLGRGTFVENSLFVDVAHLDGSKVKVKGTFKFLGTGALGTGLLSQEHTRDYEAEIEQLETDVFNVSFSRPFKQKGSWESTGVICFRYQE